MPKPPTRIRAVEEVSGNPSSNGLQECPQCTLHVDCASKLTAKSRDQLCGKSKDLWS